jgi:hypothetical protein
MLDKAYVEAWLSLIMFQEGSLLYEAAWHQVHELESKRTYESAELHRLRRQARQWYGTAVGGQ